MDLVGELDKMRKKLIFMSGLTLFFLLFISSITAVSDITIENTISEDNAVIELPYEFKRDLPSAGTTPDSWRYGFKRFVERADLFFTFDEVAKAEKQANLAELRLSEAIEMTSKGKMEFVHDLISDYEESLQQSDRLTEKAQNAGRNIVTFREQFAIATSVHFGILQDLLTTVPEQAKPAILKARDISKQYNEISLNTLEDIQPETAALIHYHIAEQRLLKALEKLNGNDSDAVEQLLAEYEGQINKSKDIIQTAKVLGKDMGNIDHIISNSTSTHSTIRSEICNFIVENVQPVIEKEFNVSTMREGMHNLLNETDNLSTVPEDISSLQEIEEMILNILS
jgi:hypothetical protein